MEGCQLRPAVLEDKAEVHRLLIDTLYKEEPLASTLAPQELPTLDQCMSAIVLPQGYSLVATTPQGVLVGVCLNEVYDPTDLNIYTLGQPDEKFQRLFNQVDEAEGQKSLPRNILELRVVAVAGEWRRRGVARRLVEATTTLARNAGFEAVKTYCTSQYTAYLVKGLGWKRVAVLKYDQFRDENGPVFTPPLPHTQVALYALRL